MNMMNSYLEELKARNPMISRILCEQEKCKWEITRGARYETVSDTSAYELSLEKSSSFKNDAVCPRGVKF